MTRPALDHRLTWWDRDGSCSLPRQQRVHDVQREVEGPEFAAHRPAPYDFDNDPLLRLPDGCWVDLSLR